MKISILLCIATMLVIALFQSSFAEAVLSPIKQLRSGIVEMNVECADHRYLVLSPNNRPSCVKIETAQKLAERGWKPFIPQTPGAASLVLKQCHDPFPPVDYIVPDNLDNRHVDPHAESYSTTFWWAPLNSVVKVCVKYYSTYDNTRVPLYVREHNSYNDTKLMIKASQDVISKGTTIVSYAIHTGHQKGQYWMSFGCGEIPLVIGSDASELNRTDYPLVRKYSCPAWTYNNSTIAGTSDIYSKHFK